MWRSGYRKSPNGDIASPSITRDSACSLACKRDTPWTPHPPPLAAAGILLGSLVSRWAMGATPWVWSVSGAHEHAIWAGGVSIFAFALALQNLIWGFAQPLHRRAGGSLRCRPGVVIGGALYALGLLFHGDLPSRRWGCRSPPGC